MADVFSKAGAVEVGKRVVKTFAQSLAGSLAMFTGIMGVDWRASLGAAGLAALMALCQNLSGTLEPTGAHAKR